MTNQQFMDISMALLNQDITYIEDQTEVPDGWAAFLVPKVPEPVIQFFPLKAFITKRFGVNDDEVEIAAFNKFLGLGGYAIYIALPEEDPNRGIKD